MTFLLFMQQEVPRPNVFYLATVIAKMHKPCKPWTSAKFTYHTSKLRLDHRTRNNMSIFMTFRQVSYLGYMVE